MSNWINLVFVVDESGSMMSSVNDVKDGWKKVISEQKANSDGRATVSLFTFNGKVTEHFIGRDVNELGEFGDYNPNGWTALYDGVGEAIHKVGEWLYERDKNGEEMPSKTIVTVITDGHENDSKEYTLENVRSMIKEQTDVYSWEFVYMGADLTSDKDADTLGFTHRAFSVRSKLGDRFSSYLNKATNCYRSCSTVTEASAAVSSLLSTEAELLNSEYSVDTGIKLKSKK